MNMTGVCGSCGSTLPDGHPVGDYCQQCPPHRCAQCGGMDSTQNACKCWIDVADIAFADLKGLFARDGVGLDIGGDPA